MACWLAECPATCAGAGIQPSSQPANYFRSSDEHKDGPLVDLRDLATYIEVNPSDVKPIIAADPDDDFILACAVVGRADYLVSYDAHFDVLAGEYQGVKITEALPFLWVVRGDKPPPARA